MLAIVFVNMLSENKRKSYSTGEILEGFYMAI